MKFILTILSLILIMPLGMAQEVALNNFKSCRIYIPSLTTDFKKIPEKEKRFYEKQWSVIAEMYEGKELIFKYMDHRKQVVVTRKALISVDTGKKRSSIRILLSNFDGPSSSTEYIDIYSDKLLGCKVYLMNCIN